MGGDWRETTLDQLGPIATGKTPPSRNPEYFGGKVPFVTPTDFDGRRRIDTTNRCLTEKGAVAVRRARIPRESVMVSCIGSDMGKSAIAGRACVTNQQINAIVVEPPNLPLFVFYNLSMRKEEIRATAGGSAQPILNKSAFGKLDILLPTPPEQRTIVHVLGTLDDKIELNRRMNETLERMARALFKSWFVDFDPVRAKMEGRETGLPDHLADLFPDQLVDSEMGEIPARWPVGTLGDIATSSRSGIDPAKTASAIPYIGLQHMPRRSVALMDWGRAGSVSSNKFAFKNGDILFGKLRPYFHKVGIAPVNGICSTDIVVLEARMPNWSAFVLVCVSSSRFVAYTSQTSTGTKMPQTSWRTMSRYELCQPTDAIATGFQQVVSPILERIVANVHESRTLGVLRDALVPKLVSGELRVRDAERLVGAVG